MFICLDAHDPMTIVDTKDGVVDKQSVADLSDIMSEGYKILGLTYKNKKLEIDRKFISSKVNALEVINPRTSFKGADLVIIRNRETGTIMGIRTKDSKEVFRTVDKKFVEAKSLDISYLKQSELTYIVTFNYEGFTEVVTYVNGRRQNKISVDKNNISDSRINIKRTISNTPVATKKFNGEVAERILKEKKINAKVVEDKDLGLTKGYLCTTGTENYWVVADGRIWKEFDGNFKIFYKPDAVVQKEKEEKVKNLRTLVMEYNRANMRGESEAKGMEKAICEKLGIQRIVSMTCGNGYADMVVVANDIQQKVKLDFRTCKMQLVK